MGLSEQQMAAKQLVELRKTRVTKLQRQLADCNQRASSSSSYWSERKNLARALDAELVLLREAKIELTKLCGTTGSDPRWELLVRSHRLLSRLEESGVALGEEGESLLSDIEFHVPLSKLTPQ